jgi:excisionase family DNA binding protein
MEAKTYNQEVLLKATQIAEILNISNSMAYRIIQTGEIRSVRIGTARRVRPEDLKVYIEENLTTDLK